MVDERQRVIAGGNPVVFAITPSLELTVDIRGGFGKDSVTGLFFRSMETDLDAGQWCPVHMNDATHGDDFFLIHWRSRTGTPGGQ